MLDGHWAGKNESVGNNDLPALFRRDDGGARLNVVYSSLDTDDADQIADAKRLLKQQQDAREKVLENILEGEANRYGSDAENFDEIGSLKRRCDDRKGDEEAEDDDAGLNHPAEQEGDSLMLLTLKSHAADQRFAQGRGDQEQSENQQRNNEIGNQGDRLIDDLYASFPGVREIDGHVALLFGRPREGGVHGKDSEVGAGTPCR